MFNLKGVYVDVSIRSKLLIKKLQFLIRIDKFEIDEFL